MLLADVAAVSAALAATPGRTAKTGLVAELLTRAQGPEVGLVVAWLSGAPRQRRTGVGWASLGEQPPPAEAAALTVTDVDAALDGLRSLAGAGSAGRRAADVRDLLSRATAQEQAFLVRLLLGELRQGPLESLVVSAVARAAGLPVADVRRAVMLQGDASAVAEVALSEGADALARVGLRPGRPVQPMLASSAPTVAAALERTGRAGVDAKLDGARVQAHRWVDDAGADQVRVVTRSLDDVTERVPEVVAVVRALPATALVLDGEVLALRADGRPRPFQETAARFASGAGAEREAVPLSVVFFDLLHLDGRDLLDEPAEQRWAALDRLVPVERRVARVVTEDPAAAQQALDAALAAGHEGVVLKAVGAGYDAGRRGAAWVKVKPVYTLDLLVVAAEWGSGRRRGWLSNLHLAARSDHGAGTVMLGKTFEGLTDELLRWQTEQLLAREVRRTAPVVHVRPELVVDIALDGL